MGANYTTDQGARPRSCITLPTAATTRRVAFEETLVLAPKAQAMRMVVVDAILVSVWSELSFKITIE